MYQFERIRYYTSFTACIETNFRLLEQVTFKNSIDKYIYNYVYISTFVYI